MTKCDDYQSQLDLIFQEIEDRKQMANQEEIRDQCRKLGSTDSAVEDAVRSLEEVARIKSGIKTDAEANAWAWAVLGEALIRNIQVPGLQSK